MISKLPRWVEYGSFVLAMVAGLVNAIGFLGFKHQAISHLSGTVTLLGTGLINSSISEVLHLIIITFSFILGASISGFFLRSGSLKLGRNYSGLLTLEALFILTATYFLSRDSLLGHYFASGACGLQNALVTTYSGAIVRTTHLTGLFTDLGIMLGGKLRGETFDHRKAILFLLIISGFIFGGFCGALLFSFLEFNALFVPATICILLALAHSIYSAKNNDQA